MLYSIKTLLGRVTDLLILASFDFYLQFYYKYDVRERVTYLLQLPMEDRRFNFLGIIIINAKLVSTYENTFQMIKCHRDVDDNMLKIFVKLLSEKVSYLEFDSYQNQVNICL